MIKKEIFSASKAANYYSAILNRIKTISKQEQITMLVISEMRESVKIKQHVVGLLNLTNSTGTGMTEDPFELLKWESHSVMWEAKTMTIGHVRKNSEDSLLYPI